MARDTSLNLTEGSIVKKLIIFILPILAGQIFQNLYNSVDAIVVGNYVGTTALAAVTSSSDVAQLLTGFFTGLSIGAGVVFARLFGAKRLDRLHDAIHTGMLFSVILGVLMALLGIVLTPFLLEILQCPADVYDEAGIYLRIYLIGILFTSMYNVGSGVLRSVGDSRTPLIFLVISSLINVALDMLFVAALKMGVEGVAIATIISQLVSCILVYVKLARMPSEYRLRITDLKIDGGLLKEIIGLGIPNAIQSGLLALSNMFVQGYVNSFGSAAMAGIGTAKKIDKYIGLSNMAIAQGITTFVSQNMGAGKTDRAFKGIRIAILMAFVCMTAIGIPIYFNADACVRLFTSDNAAVAYGVAMIKTLVPFYMIQALGQINGHMVRGFGKSFWVMILSLAGLVGCRQGYLLITMGINRVVDNVYYSYIVGWAGSAILVGIYYLFFVRPKYYKKKTIEPEK